MNWWYLNNTFLKYLFIYFWLHWVLVSAHQIFTVVWGLSSYGTRALECMGSVGATLRLICSMWDPCGMWDLSSPSRDRTCISCIEKWVLKHWTSREVPIKFSFKWKVSKAFKRHRIPAVWHEPLTVSYFLIPEYNNHAYYVSGTVLGALHAYVII